MEGAAVNPKTIREARCLFTALTAKLITWAVANGYEVSFEETKRSQAQAKENAQLGVGISNSLHTIGLAVDLNLYIDTQWQQASEAHAPLGAYWKSLHPLCRWGGDFRDKNGKPKPDGNHYSLEWGGRK